MGTNFYGEVTSRRNPIDLQVCCGNCPRIGRLLCRRPGPSPPVPPPNCAPPLPDGSSCDFPLTLAEVGGYQVVFTGLFRHTNRADGNQLALSVQELFRQESKVSWEELRPKEFIQPCDDDAVINHEWKERIKDVRPTKCSVGYPEMLPCGPSRPGAYCAAYYNNTVFASKYQKGVADNELGLGQLKYTYSLVFQSECYARPTDPVSWNVIRSHSLLRPNGWAYPADEFCVVSDNFYATTLNDDLIQVSSPPAICRRPAPVDFSPDGFEYCRTAVSDVRPIPFQRRLQKKDQDKGSQ